MRTTDPAPARVAAAYEALGMTPEQYGETTKDVHTTIASFTAAYFDTPDGVRIPGVCYQTDYRAEEEYGLGALRTAFCGDDPRSFGMSKRTTANVTVFEDGTGMVLSVDPLDREQLPFGDPIRTQREAQWGITGRTDYASSIASREASTRKAAYPYDAPSMAVLRAEARELGIRPIPPSKAALVEAIRDARGTGADCWPAWFENGEQLVLRARGGLTGEVLALLVAAARAGRLGFGSASGPFHSGLFLYDTAHETKQLQRERTAAFDWHDEQMKQVQEVAEALKAHDDLSVHFLGNPREGTWNDEDGTVRYWLNADWAYSSPIRREIEAAGFTRYEVGLSGWWTREQLGDVLADPRSLLAWHVAERERTQPIRDTLVAAGCTDVKIEAERVPTIDGSTTYRFSAKRAGEYVLDDPRASLARLTAVAADVEGAIDARRRAREDAAAASAPSSHGD